MPQRFPLSWTRSERLRIPLCKQEVVAGRCQAGTPAADQRPGRLQAVSGRERSQTNQNQWQTTSMCFCWSRTWLPFSPALIALANFPLQGRGRWFEPSSAHEITAQISVPG